MVAWISAYVRCRNVAQASIEVGIDPRSGKNLRNRPDIHLAIERLTEKSVMKYGFDATEIMERVKEISGLDPVELENPDGTFKKHFKDIAPEVRRAIKKLKVKNYYETDPNGFKVLMGEIIEYEFYDKMEAHKLLGQEKNIFKPTQKVEHDIGTNMRDVLLEGAKRGEAKAIEVTGRTVTEVGADDAQNTKEGESTDL